MLTRTFRTMLSKQEREGPTRHRLLRTYARLPMQAFSKLEEPQNFKPSSTLSTLLSEQIRAWRRYCSGREGPNSTMHFSLSQPAPWRRACSSALLAEGSTIPRRGGSASEADLTLRRHVEPSGWEVRVLAHVAGGARRPVQDELVSCIRPRLRKRYQFALALAAEGAMCGAHAWN
mmetsp:Transcript_36141/g.96298  ORF Transcript_36141/g.96298 Transcript_36141/m.96298 type:complete len:175 (+) Transcript_36141:255-779(+)